MKTTDENYVRVYEAEGNSKNIKEYAICSGCKNPYGKRIKKNYKVYAVGKKEGDFYKAIICQIVSRSLLAELQKENVTGFEVMDMICTKWVDHRGNPIAGKDFSKYKELLITGRTGLLKDINGNVLKMDCEVCGRLQIGGEGSLDEAEGLMVDENEWDGSDMFYFKNWEGNLIVTERVKTIIEKGKFRNIEFYNLKDYRG